jgi:hypothetical protein
MLTGIAVLGLLAGSLASFFRLTPGDDSTTEGEEDATPDPRSDVAPAAPTPADVEAALLSLTREVAALREQVTDLAGRVTGKD